MINTKFFITIVLLCFTCTSQFSDELDHHYEISCIDEDTVPCGSGGCFHQSQLCDGNIDCDDATDENFCTSQKLDAAVCNMTHQFTCANGNGCIPIYWICNNHKDCEDGSDEVNCTRSAAPVSNNATCKGFRCADSGKCISKLWVCDGVYDCADMSDEINEELCRHQNYSHELHVMSKGDLCFTMPGATTRNYICQDYTYCLSSHMMCDGIPDCRDESDEGPFCANWLTMCDKFECRGNETKCFPDRSGPVCTCLPVDAAYEYNYTTHLCQDIDECLLDHPECSHKCVNGQGNFRCYCDPGYKQDWVSYLCFTTGPEGMLFFSTQNDIRYIKIKSKQMVTVASGLKQAHGVVFDGTYVYWVETAQGHQCIFKAQLDDVKETKQVLVGLGLEEPGDIAVDYLGGNIYFSDSERGIISACRTDGTICTTIKMLTKHPKFVTLDAKNGQMYWADWHDHGVIMTARMDGSLSEVLVDNLQSFATGLAIDAPNGRLYYVDKTIRVIKLEGRLQYSLFEEPFHHPYSISVFEHTVFWSDWASNTIQTTDKIHGSAQLRNALLSLDTAIIGMHMYHPALVNATINPCSNNNCSHLCFVISNASHVCGCPDGMEIKDNNECVRADDYRAKYLVVGVGDLFTKIQYNELGNPESHATHFDIGRVQAMAYDNVRDTLYIYDVHLKTISYISMNEFTLGVTHRILQEGLENVVDMDYEYVADSIYILDAGRRLVEVFSLRTRKRALVYKFEKNEVPISLCVMPDYGRVMVAVIESEHHDVIHIDSIGLDGQDRKHIIMNNLRGPHVRLRYVQQLDNVFISDESNGAIDYIHPDGTGRECYRELTTTVTSMAVADNYVFWTDRRTSRLFWSDIHETSQKIRRLDLTLFLNKTQLLLQATSSAPDPKDPLLGHPCRKDICSDVCVQLPHETPHAPNFHMDYKCLCTPGYFLQDLKCTKVVNCSSDELICHRSNMCVSKDKRCDGFMDCRLGEDEEGCKSVDANDICTSDEFYCRGVCLNRKKTSMCNGVPIDTDESISSCSTTEFQCANSSVCISRLELCDGSVDCPYGDDELSSECDTFSCYDSEFMCASGSCILQSFTCDGEDDCPDGSDEQNCDVTCAPGYFQCRSKDCIEVSRRCDGQQDCFDFSDEEDCSEPTVVEITVIEPRCQVWEYACEHNSSVCLPRTARLDTSAYLHNDAMVMVVVYMFFCMTFLYIYRCWTSLLNNKDCDCNGRVECPGGNDEYGCNPHCDGTRMFTCFHEVLCVSLRKVCNGHWDCGDGSDETPDACDLVNKTSKLFPKHSVGECIEGFRCKDGQCIEWQQVCDNHADCFDKTDENGTCLTSCTHDKCSYKCQPTPSGPRCLCPFGYELGQDQYTCEDIDECQDEVCSQICINKPGTFRCACHHGYVPRVDRRSCKATKGGMSIVYVLGNTIRSLSSDGNVAVDFTDPEITDITDMDLNVRENKFYVTSAESNNLYEVDGQGHKVVTVTNIGKPTKVALDWITGNVYFVDSTPSASRIRLCHIKQKRCAVLQKLPSNAKVTALIVDPSSHRMFYCVTRGEESVVWTASLTGTHVADLTTMRNCTGLAVDPFNKKLYVAETGPAHITRMDYEGDSHKKILADHPQLQDPQGLAIFEDYIYYQVADAYRLGRCRIFGPKHCENYSYRVFNASTFAIRHESVQRDDLVNGCEGKVCSNICTFDERGPKCICDDGTFEKNGKCPELVLPKLPLFNGRSYNELARSPSIAFKIVSAVLGLAVAYLCVFLYYHFVHKPRRDRDASYAEVRFQNTSADNPSTSQDIAVEITPGRSRDAAHEFVNPLQFVRNVWYRSFQRHSTPTLIEHVAVITPSSPTQNDLSDTESDLDSRESANILKP